MDLSNLSNNELSLLMSMCRGMGWDAKPGSWKTSPQELKSMKRLVELGLARLSKPVPWAKHGIYVLADPDKARDISKAIRQTLSLQKGNQP